MRVNVYKPSCNSTNYKPELIITLNVRLQYESSFYFRNMPAISAKICRKIIRQLNNGILYNEETLLFENVKTGHRGIQKMYKNGTILNF